MTCIVWHLKLQVYVLQFYSAPVPVEVISSFLCFLIDICFCYQSKHNTLNTKRSFIFYSMFRSSSGTMKKTNVHVHWTGGLPIIINALMNSLAFKVCNNCILISFDYHCVLFNIIPLLEILDFTRIYNCVRDWWFKIIFSVETNTKNSKIAVRML
jgi:hypothetical protein